MFNANKLKAIKIDIVRWFEKLKEPQELEPLPITFWKIVLAFGFVLLIDTFCFHESRLRLLKTFWMRRVK